MAQIGTPTKPVRMKPRSQQNGRPRQIDKAKFDSNWDKIFGKKDKENK